MKMKIEAFMVGFVLTLGSFCAVYMLHLAIETALITGRIP